MNAAQRYKIRIDYEDQNGVLHRFWNPGRYAKLPRVYEYIEAVKLRCVTRGFRFIAYEIWDTYTRKCIEAKTYS